MTLTHVRTAGISIAMSCVVIAFAWASRPPCSVDVRPNVSLEPLRYVRVKVVIDDGSGGTLALVDEISEWTSSKIQAGPRTTWIEWKNVVLEAGEYEVALRTAGGCTARGRLEVD